MAHDNKKLLQPLLLKPKNTRDHGNDPNPVSMVFEYNATQNMEGRNLRKLTIGAPDRRGELVQEVFHAFGDDLCEGAVSIDDNVHAVAALHLCDDIFDDPVDERLEGMVDERASLCRRLISGVRGDRRCQVAPCNGTKVVDAAPS